MLSARGEEYDKLAGFDLGIDDYMTKPFSPKELMARINAVTKRYKGEESFFKYKDLKVDFLGHSVYIKDKELPLTPKEYDLLVYFINNNGIALSREQLLNKMLRNNLGEYRDLITTVRRMGYKFDIKDKEN